MHKPLRRFLGIWVASCMALAAFMIVFNAMVDPYMVFGVPRIVAFNARKPAVDTQERWMKVYEVLRDTPNTLILGSSRVDFGLDGQDPAWPAPDRPVYNLGFAGGSPYVAYRYLQHVISKRHLALVVLGLDFEYFLQIPDANRPAEPEFELRLAVRSDGSANRGQAMQHARDIFQAVFSLDAMTDSFWTLIANFKGDSSDLIVGNRVPSVSYRRSIARGSYPLVALSDLVALEKFRAKERNQLAMADLKNIVDLCESEGTRVILFINPVHADQLEVFELLGYWQAFEDWKREIVELTARYNSMKGPIPLWDFAGYDSYSTEPVPPDGYVLQWFWEPAHYTKALGDS